MKATTGLLLIQPMLLNCSLPNRSAYLPLKYFQVVLLQFSGLLKRLKHLGLLKLHLVEQPIETLCKHFKCVIIVLA